MEGERQQGPKPEEPVEKWLIVNDATAAAMHRKLAENPWGILLFRDELSGWLETISNGQQGERQFFLESWDGDTPCKMSRIERGTLTYRTIVSPSSEESKRVRSGPLYEVTSATTEVAMA